MKICLKFRQSENNLHTDLGLLLKKIRKAPDIVSGALQILFFNRSNYFEIPCESFLVATSFAGASTTFASLLFDWLP